MRYLSIGISSIRRMQEIITQEKHHFGLVTPSSMVRTKFVYFHQPVVHFRKLFDSLVMVSMNRQGILQGVRPKNVNKFREEYLCSEVK